MSTSIDHNCNKCCPGPIGPQGQMGSQGPQGIDGAQGIPGQDGLIGPMGHQGFTGPMGPQGNAGQPGENGQSGPMGQQGSQGSSGPVGPQGNQGPQGIPGNCIECPCDCDELEFAEVYSQSAQQLLPSAAANQPGGVVKLENTIVATSNIDTSMTASLGQVRVNLAGWYDVAAGMTGTLNPIPAPLPVWTLSLFLNGVIVPGSTFSNVPLSPAQASNEITADTYVYFNVGDTLTLANTSTAPVFLSAPTLGTNAQTNSAYLKLVLLRAGPK